MEDSIKNIKKEIEQLKREKDVVILAHYYVDGEVQALADYVGDSYFLAKKATEITERNILFCGVSFMGRVRKSLTRTRMWLWQMILLTVRWHIC